MWDRKRTIVATALIAYMLGMLPWLVHKYTYKPDCVIQIIADPVESIKF